MPTHLVQQMLSYDDNKEAIEILGQAIDLLGHKDIAGALDVLMAYRNHLQDSQRPILKQYDPRQDRPPS